MKKSRLRMLAFFLCTAIISGAVSIPETVKAEAPIIEYVDYDITENTTWHAGDYYICKTDNREPRITNGATLTIENGTNVYFSTNTNTLLPDSGGKYPYSHLKVTDGALSAAGVTFTAVNGWEASWWDGIRAVAIDSTKPASLTFTDCVFQYSGKTGYTLDARDSNEGGDGQTINISVTGCTFEEPFQAASAADNPTAIRYNNGYHFSGRGTISAASSTFSGYGRGIQVIENSQDDIDTFISGCTFENISLRPVEIQDGREASVTNCIFNNVGNTQHNGTILIFDKFAVSSQPQTVTLTGNTFNGDSDTAVYPVSIGGGVSINEGITGDSDNNFNAGYPAEYRYIEFVRNIGSSNFYENAVWGNAGIPYLLTAQVTIDKVYYDSNNHSQLQIKPGVTVCFVDNNLNINGTLLAEGTAEKPITFIKKPGAASAGELYANDIEGRVVLKHCVIDGLYRGINVDSTSHTDEMTPILLENCVIRNTKYGSALANTTNPAVIRNCSIIAGQDSIDNGFILNNTRFAKLQNCTIAGFPNYGVVIYNSPADTLAAGAPLIENCTVTSNGLAGVIFAKSDRSAYGAFIRSSIIANNGVIDLANGYYPTHFDKEVTIKNGSITYSLIGSFDSLFSGTPSTYTHTPSGDTYALIPASAYSSRLDGDPLFADAANGDYHLKSAAGRWNGSAWVTDTVTSPCIDAGDPSAAYASEPAPNGGLINIGCYGNTTEASKSTGGTSDTAPPSWNIDSTLTASAITQTGATLSWSGASDDTAVTVYGVYRDGTLIQTTANTTYAVSGLTPGTEYSFKVEAGDAADNWSTNGPTTSVHTPAATNPSVTVSANPSGSVDLNETITFTATVTGITNPSYQWYSNTTNSTAGGNEISGATNAAYQLTAGTTGTTYYYCVVNSVISNVVSANITSPDNDDPPANSYVPDNAFVNHDDRMTVDLTSGSTVLSADQIDTLITLNKNKPIVLTGDGFTITFPKDDLKLFNGRRDYDFGIRFNTGTSYDVIRSTTGDGFVLMLDFNHSGTLPGEAQIRIRVGTQYAGDKLFYYYCNPQTGNLVYMLAATVDASGYVTINQSRCSSYVFTLNEINDSDDLPQTGNAGSSLIWRGVWTALFVIGITALLLAKKKVCQRRQQNIK